MAKEPEEKDCTTSAESDASGERLFVQLIDTLPKVSVQGYDRNRRVIYWNSSSADIYGYSKEEALGRKLEDLIIPAEMAADVIRLHKDWMEKGIAIPSAELVLKHKDGRPVPVYSSHVMLKEHTSSPEMFCIDVDLREQYTAREELRALATTDALTGLPNRRFLAGELSRLICQKQVSNEQFAVLFIDLDLFKEVNDTLGHTWGDKLLGAVAERLKSELLGANLLARFGGDEFVLVAPDIASVAEVSALAERLLLLFRQSFSFDNESVYITASIGISTYPADGTEPETLLKHADAAMYCAKESGRNRAHLFTAELSRQLQAQREIGSGLRDSIGKGEFELVYQPQFDMTGQTVKACEALLRWRPQVAGIGASPDIFIPIAERSDLIILIGDWVMEQACAQVSAWKKRGFNVRVDINVSGKQLEQADFFTRLEQCRSSFGLSPGDLGIELTEHVLIKSNDRMLAGLRELKEKGVEISIDDFGTGYSSLNYLKIFPITNLKIDRAFVAEAPENELDGALLEAIVHVGHRLKFDIVVEGIETERQAEFCRRLAIDYAQGYWFSKPLSADEVTRFFEQSAVNE
ncbi:putative bifunctional diguanylate cyclase/phosphodiesterase [Marinobacterium lutimaris]|uniref:PAS domain S-box-containing protein/diguanylate cyclase (GGDEF) domain-containing protein n=1 Tax=Marinobacterium lutimaris TaxID=568106 RepID=A0A1H5XAX3_9GAMM|nr:EAL domain-containing protein [Marinobacterium lutimaris]SEG08889.1 PAS domain S-box-containing protein/diguanylate cyclase (GGDEF) domain-containing protein [Marinobacterium lutimaris]